jgi:hypothetical protein
LPDIGEASYMVPLDPSGVIFSLKKQLHPAWWMARKEWYHWALPIFARCERRPPKPVWRGGTREDSVEGIQGPPLCKPCTWGGSPYIVARCQLGGPGLKWAIWEYRPSGVGRYARFWL